MKYTVGCDITEVARIKKAAENEKFLRRVFSSEEIAQFEKKPSPYESMAGAWAAKEAFAKSLGTGVRGFGLNEITVAHDEFGAPFLKLTGSAAVIAAGLEFSLSISHTKTIAQAVCIAQRKGQD